MSTMSRIGEARVVPAVAAPFRRSLTGWLVAGLNLLAALNSTWVFLDVLGSGLLGWLMMNSCAPSIFLFVGGFLAASPVAMVASAVLMFRYGTLGLFFFSWQGHNLIAQVSHVLMTLAVLYVAADVWRQRRWRALLLGLAVGAALLAPYMLAQAAWFDAHPGLLEQLFQGFEAPTGS